MSTLRLRIEPPNGPAQHHQCAASSLVVGRSSRADLVVTDPCVSRRHARLFREDEDWYVEDLGSRSPTRVNGEVVQAALRLQPGDVIRVGDTQLHVEGERPLPAADDEALLRSSSLVAVSSADVLSGVSGEALPEQLASRLRLINEVHRALAGPISLEDLLALVLERAFAVLKPEEGVVFLKHPTLGFEQSARRRASGLSGDYLYSRRLIQEVTEKGLAALVNDVVTDDRFKSSDSILGSGVLSIVAAPMLDTEGCLGMIALNSKVRKFTESDRELLVSLASAAALRIRNIALSEEAAQRRLLEKELAVAHDIQQGMLPKRFPERPEFELAAVLHPAKSVGGDLYDVFLGDEHLWFLVGDVSGKGVGAALFMAVVRTLFRAVVRGASSLSSVMGRINQELGRDNERAMFVTAFAGRLELATGALSYVNAGHAAPLRLSRDGSMQRLSAGHGIALGVLDDVVYEEARVVLAPGDDLFVYTDGIPEALNAGDEQFGEERLEAGLRGLTGASPDAIIQAALAAVRKFAGGAPQFDDITALALRFRRD